ncbi:LysE/ArgO family amino acid transporter [Agrococcus sediminis]|uniref:LysE/ArgO family amino acid transporter n=1 Tax=Agrococcus TaxID=46352 RepID=UPI001FF29784|nr:LysE/ArgO family amino acid transporter [Agrococcus sp. SCSIO52902]UOW00947.1 LysE/ArgO family amino acid transporter [Agrococcus sp. SCSIO52902]
MDQQLIALASGLGASLGLIIAIGAQNVHVLRQGMRREHVGLVIAICAVSDALLETAGVAGLGAVISGIPWLEAVARWGGALFLLVYAALAARRAWRGDDRLELAPEPVGEGEAAPGAPAGTAVARRSASALSVAGTTLAITWLNPHVYLDTVVLLGSVSTGFAEDRWWFLAGSIAGSVVWFTALGLGARLLAPVLRTRRAWRILDAGIAAVMLAIAIALVAG